jgi:hypothetical protein
MVATENGHATTVKFLPVAGATITKKNDYGWSALHALRCLVRKAIAALVQCFLKEAGVNISDATNDGKTILSLLQLKYVALASLLKIHGHTRVRPTCLLSQAVANTYQAHHTGP